MTGKCIWCGGDLIWDSDFTTGDVYGETGDPKDDDRLYTFAHCSECNAIVTFEEAPEDD